MLTIIISKDGVCRNIVFGSPIHLNSSENLTSYNSIKDSLGLLRLGRVIGHEQLHTAVLSQLWLLLEEPQEPCAATV